MSDTYLRLAARAVPSAHTQPDAPPEPAVLTRTGTRLYLLAVFSLVISVIDVPFLGVSLSAPLLGLVMLEIFFRPRYKFGRMRQTAILWGILFLIMLGLVQLIASAQHEIPTLDALRPLIQWVFWIVSLLVVVYVGREARLLKQTVILFGIGIMVTAGLRLFESARAGDFSATFAPRINSQNNYGILFSMFAVYTLYLFIAVRKSARLPVLIGIALTFSALIINGSRSSWLAVTVGVFTLSLVYVLSYPRLIPLYVAGLIAGGIFLAILSPYLPSQFQNIFEERIETFEDLDSDKSFLIRQLMIDKGLQVFSENPLFGVGLGRFTQTSVPLVLPPRLRYADEAYFNRKPPHNSYIALLSETGLAATLPYAALFITAVVLGLRAAIRCVRHALYLGAFAYASLIGMSVHLFTLTGLTGTAPWVVYGLMIALIYYARDLPAQAPPAAPQPNKAAFSAYAPSPTNGRSAPFMPSVPPNPYRSADPSTGKPR
ncbi:MAG: O-antigen ligase family protein [bacterium]|nr:O-antigen ligase family protein [bacterium]